MNHFLQCSCSIVLGLMAATTVRAQPADPICGTWRFWNNSVREMRPDGSSGPVGKPADAAWKRVTPGGIGEPSYRINYGGGKAFDTLTLRGGASQLWGMNGPKPFLTASRIGDLPLSASSPASRPGQKPPSSPESMPAQNQRRLLLANDWMPARQDISREFAKSLAFYCQHAVGDAPRGSEPVPGTIIWNLEWLMPLADAEARVPGVMRLQRAYDLRNPGFPHNSIYIRSLYGKFVDPQTHEVFNICNLIGDAGKQLISVELVATNPKAITNPQIPAVPQLTPKNDPKALPTSGTMEPYYDFIEVKANGSTSQRVQYDVTSPNAGVTVIHTMLVKGISVQEPVRWYLPAPFARILLDMVEKIAPSGKR